LDDGRLADELVESSGTVFAIEREGC